MLPNIRSHSPGGKLPDPFRDAIPGPLRRVREPLDDRAAVPSSMGSIVKKQAHVVKGDDSENTLRRYESLTHFSPVVVKSVCGGYLACGLSAGLRCGYPPSPLRHLSC